MSKYTRSHDTTNRNYDISGKPFESQRRYDRGKFDNPDVGAPKFEFGISYSATRAQESTTKSDDTSSRIYDTSTGDYDSASPTRYDVTSRTDDVAARRSPARTPSLSDHSRNQPANVDAPYEYQSRHPGRQRLNSGESSGSVSSEKSEDRSLLNVLKNRYKENAEKQANDPASRAPFSTWRRSGHYDDVASSTTHDGDKDKAQLKFEKSNSIEKTRTADSSLSKRDSHHEDWSHVKDTATTAESRAEPSPDDLLYKFRSAFCRHQLSKHDKEEEPRDKAVDVITSARDIEDVVEKKLERISTAIARAKGQNTDKPRPPSFATEFKVKDGEYKVKPDEREKADEYKKLEKFETKPEIVPEEHMKEPHRSSRLSRQKLVSDDLKAKYIESRKDEKVTEKQEDTLAKKRSSRRSKHQDHMDYWSKDQDKEKSTDVEELNKTDSVPTVEEMLHGSARHIDKSPSFAAKKVDHSSPFGSVYTKKPTQPPSPSPSPSSGIKPDKGKEGVDVGSVKLREELPQEVPRDSDTLITDSKEKTPAVIEAKEKKSSGRKLKKYTKAKSLELGALSKTEPDVEPAKVEYKDDTKVGTSVDIGEEERLKRINRYKEERKKQLAAISSKFDNAEKEMPSLFLLGKAAEKDTSVQRSKSMKVETDKKHDYSPISVARSKSLKHDKDLAPPEIDTASVPKITALKFAEIGDQLKQDKERQGTEREVTLNRLKDQSFKCEPGTNIGELQNKKLSMNSEDTGSIDRSFSYSTKILLADRVVEDSSSLHVPNRDRYRSTSSDRPRSRDSSRESTPKVRSLSEKGDAGLKTKLRTFSDKSHEDSQSKCLFEFGTVYTKKDKPKGEKDEGSEKVTSTDRSRTPSEKDEESGRESVDLHSRIRRKLPSIEDVLGTSEDEIFENAKMVIPDNESATESISAQVKTDYKLTEKKADESQKKSVLDNIKRVKSKFQDDSQGLGVFGTKYEMGSKIVPKQVDKTNEIEKALRTVNKANFEIDTVNKGLNSMDVESTRQKMLGLKANIKEERPPVIDSSETLSSVRKEIDPVTGLYKVRQTGYKAKVYRTPSRETSEERATQKQEASQTKKALSKVKEKSEELIMHKPETTGEHLHNEDKGIRYDKDLKPPSSPRTDRKNAIAEKFNKASKDTFQFGTVYTTKKEEQSSVKDDEPVISPVIDSKIKSSSESIMLASQNSSKDSKKLEPKFDNMTTFTSSAAGNEIEVSDASKGISSVTTKGSLDSELLKCPVSSLVYQPPAEPVDLTKPQTKNTVSFRAFKSPASPPKVARAEEEPVSPFAYEPPPAAKILGAKQVAHVSKPISLSSEPQATLPVSIPYDPQSQNKTQNEVIKEHQVTKLAFGESPTVVRIPSEIRRELQIAQPISFANEPQLSTKAHKEMKKEPKVDKPVSFSYEPQVGGKAQVQAKKNVDEAKPVSFAYEPQGSTKALVEVKKEPEVVKPVSFVYEPQPATRAQVEAKKKTEVAKPILFANEPQVSTKVQVEVKKESEVVKPVSFVCDPPVANKAQGEAKKKTEVAKPVSFAYEPEASIQTHDEVKEQPGVAKPVSFAYVPQTILKEQPDLKNEPEPQPPIETHSEVRNKPDSAKPTSHAFEPSLAQIVAKNKAPVSQPAKMSEFSEPKQEPKVTKPVPPILAKTQTETESRLQATKVIAPDVQKADTKREALISATTNVFSPQKECPVTESISSVKAEEAADKMSDESEKESTVFNVQTGSMTELVVLKPVTPTDTKEVPSQTQYLENLFEKAKDMEAKKSEEDLTKSESDHVDTEHTIRASLTVEHKVKKRTEEEEEIAHAKLEKDMKDKEDKTVAFIKVQDLVTAKKKEMDKKRGRKLERSKSAKGKPEKSVLTKLRVECQLQDVTTLDDILDRNVEYLSDLEPPDISGGKRGSKTQRPDQTKAKRSLKKKSMKRSKSEDRSHFQIPDSDEDKAAVRSRVTDDLKSTTFKLPGSRGDRAAATQKTVPPSTTDAVRARQKHGTSSQQTPGTSSTTGTVSKNADGLEPVKTVSPVTQSADSLQAGPGSRLTTEISQVTQSGNDDQVDTATIAQTVSARPEAPVVTEGTVTMTSVEQVSGMASDTSELSDRRRFERQSIDSSRDSETSKISDSDMSVSSALSEGSRKRRKDKSSLRKSKLNESGDDAPLSSRRRDSTESSRASRSSVRRVASSRLAREPPPADKTAQKDEVSAAISRLSEASEKSSRESSLLYKKSEQVHTPRGIRRENNFSKLLQKFSGSEASSSEKSDTESPRSRKILLKGQGAYTASSESSDEVRRTPERSQSLRLRTTASPASDRESSGSSVQRSSSFKSDFMKRRFSPDPENRRRLPETPSEQSDKPSPELASVLNKRNTIVTKQQEEGEVIERQRIHDGRIEKSELFKETKSDDIIADSEVLQMLRSRRRETDSSVSESEQKSQKPSTDTSVPQSTSSVITHKQPDAVTETPKLPKVQQAVEVQKPVEESKDKNVKRLSSQSSFESKTTITLSSPPVNKVAEPPVTVPQVKEVPKPAKAEAKTVAPLLDLTAIDTSLQVLNKVSTSVHEREKPSDKESKLEKALSNVNVTSETEIVNFIKDVESDKIAPAKVTTVQSSLPSSMIREEEEFRRSASPASPAAGTIDITSKSEIKKKFSAREITPERQSPLRSIPMKVTSPMKATVGLSRTESMGRSESERPKGILKRTPSLKQTGVIVDPELAEVLKSRRQKQSDDEEQEQSKMSVEEEIRQQRELQTSKDESAEREVSVAERVFQMHNKIEEIRSCPITPRRSGFGTPKAILHLSGPGTPGNQLSFDEGKQQQEPLSGTQLIERLASLEGQQALVSEKRKRFQQVRKKEDWRTRTQPVTLHEIQQADSLETVRKFRTEVIQKATEGLFEELEKEEEKQSQQKTEYPQHVKHERRHRGERHKTLPITAAELNAIPEGQVSGTTNTLKKKFENLGAWDSKGDSGILSGSDGDNLSRDSDSYRSLGMEENIDPNDPVKMSVSAKASMFHQIQESLKERQEKRSASGAKRYIDRKKRERSRTLPITEDEVKLAAEIADKDEEEAKKEADETAKVTGTEPTVENAEEADELSRQSLKDKVKLFTSIEEEKKAAAKTKGAVPPPPKRRSKRLASRFATQPVTYEEVEKAAKISPLACSLIKPPDPEILSGLSVKAQRELIAKHAEKALSQPGSRTGSRPSSRSTSVTDLSTVVLNEDALTLTNTEVNENIGGWEPSDRVRPSDLKGKAFTAVKQEEHKTQTIEKITTELDSSRKSILKSELEQKLTLGILKPHGDAAPTLSDIKSILKKDSSFETTKSEVKGILKKESSFETRKVDSDKSAMKPSDSLSKDVDTCDTLESDTKEPDGVESSGDNLDSDEGILDGADKSEATDVKPHRKSKDKRRFNRDRKLEAERYKTQPAEPASEETARPKKKYVSRHLTQPITPDEKKEAETVTATPEITKSGSISDRLNALKKNGEEGWKKRLSRPDDLDALERRSLTPPSTPPMVKMRDKKNLDTPRPSSIADRLSLLDSAQAGWRERIGETDVKKFTIEHKISSSGQPVGESPLVTRLKGRGLRKELSRESESSENSDLPSPSSPTKESSKIPMPREVVCTDIPPELLKPDTKSPLVTIKSEEEEKPPVNVEVPDINAEMEHFFVKKEALEKEQEKIEVSIDDFDELFMTANDILETTRKIKPKRRHNPSSRNPMKTMSACLEVKSEYTEVITGVADRELKRQKTAQISQNSGFAVEALAGLASKENFAKVELRKTDSTGASRLDPYLPLMLIHIKGRRKVQCRLVEPSAKSLNSGDCFVLITPDKNIMWCGDYCNVIEKAKAADFCDQVKQKRDLGCKGARDITILEEKRAQLGVGRKFWELLGGQEDYMACGPPEEDELYENHIVETNMIYRMEDNKLVPDEENWGSQPKYKMLKSDQVYVFDFGSEVYLWQGKSVSPNQRKISMRLAEQVWSKGYDYSQCDINPLSPLRAEEEGGLPNISDTRPDWALFGKVNQNMETILFREKFADWPDTSRLIKVKSQEDADPAKIDLADLKPYDAKLMVPVSSKPVTMVLDGSNVGRGLKWEQDMDGFIQTQLIETLKVRVWHVLEYDHYEIEDHSFGQFHEGDTYVIRWQFMIVNAGMKNLKGQASRHSHMGRERCAYFFWQGKTSTINEKGASALMTVELDEERGPQVRVDEGKEPPCFLNLFKGRMIIHIGKREEEETNTMGPWKFYCLRNEYESEICLIEVPRDIANLRSVSSFILLNVKTGRLMVWHGCKSPDHTKKLAATAAGFLKERCPLEVGLHKGKAIDISQVQEGEEGLDFWRVVNVTRNDRSGYHSLLKHPESFNHTLRLFHMTSVSGVFEAQEILNPSRTPELPTKFPVLQTDLYKASQPALFLIDNGHEVYLWQGWLPEADENQENVLTGSAVTRLSMERKCAMETTIQYCKEINPDDPPLAYLVYAGLEPLCFTNLFPLWTVDENVKEINLRAVELDAPLRPSDQDGKSNYEMVLVEELLKKVTKTRYTLSELLEIPPPEGVDPLKLESYLSDEEFTAVLDMTREEFYALPTWKQSKVKQQAGLY